MSDWEHKARTDAAANGDGGTSKLTVATSRVASGNGLDRAISGRWDEDGECEGGSPHRGASRGHRNEPFFIGVAGGTASGECRWGGANNNPGQLHGMTESRAIERSKATPLHPFACLSNCRQDYCLRSDHPEATRCAACPRGRGRVRNAELLYRPAACASGNPRPSVQWPSVRFAHHALPALAVPAVCAAPCLQTSVW